MIKVLGSPDNKRWVGDTAGLLELHFQGKILRYEIPTGVPEYAVAYSPRSKRDPMPWVQVGGLESRMRSGEIVAIEADAFAAWEASRIETGEDKPTERPAGPRYEVDRIGTYFVIRDTVAELDVASMTSRYAAQDKADRLNAGPAPVAAPQPTDGPPKCAHGRYLYRTLRGKPIPSCESGSRYGVWDDGVGGFTYVVDCAQEAATWAEKQTDEEPDSELEIKEICPDHSEQPRSTCEECFSEGCGAVDASDLDACGHCSDCTF